MPPRIAAARTSGRARSGPAPRTRRRARRAARTRRAGCRAVRAGRHAGSSPRSGTPRRPGCRRRSARRPSPTAARPSPSRARAPARRAARRDRRRASLRARRLPAALPAEAQQQDRALLDGDALPGGAGLELLDRDRPPLLPVERLDPGRRPSVRGPAAPRARRCRAPRRPRCRRRRGCRCRRGRCRARSRAGSRRAGVPGLRVEAVEVLVAPARELHHDVLGPLARPGRPAKPGEGQSSGAFMLNSCPVRTSPAAAAVRSGVSRFRQPSWSSAPKTPHADPAGKLAIGWPAAHRAILACGRGRAGPRCRGRSA